VGVWVLILVILVCHSKSSGCVEAPPLPTEEEEEEEELSPVEPVPWHLLLLLWRRRYAIYL